MGSPKAAQSDITPQTIKVLGITARAQPEVAAQANEIGANGFMTKPFRQAEDCRRAERTGPPPQRQPRFNSVVG
jgi:CheY-like chemotaxis protein